MEHLELGHEASLPVVCNTAAVHWRTLAVAQFHKWTLQ